MSTSLEKNQLADGEEQGSGKPLLLLTVKEASQQLRVSESTVRRMIKDKQIHSVKVRGRGPFLRPADLRAYIDRCAGQAVPTDEEDTCKSAKQNETRTAFSSGRTRRSGGRPGSPDKVTYLADLLASGKKTTRKRPKQDGFAPNSSLNP